MIRIRYKVATTASTLALIGAMTAAPSAAWAQTADPASAPNDVQTEAAASSDDDIVVTGVRRSLEAALDAKRRSNEVLDSLSSEGIGKLPDLNLAESLQRIPGVQINRSSLRRTGNISVRGLPGGFIATQINGMPLTSPNITGFSFGTVRSEAFSRIDVVKAQGADRFTGGLAGVVDLRTGDPLDSENSIALSAEGQYERYTDAILPGGALTINHQLVPGVLGFRVAAGYRRLNFRDDQVSINTYDRTAGSGTPNDASDDIYEIRQLRLGTNVVRGDAFTASGAVEWEPTDTINVRLSAFHNIYTYSGYQTQYQVEALSGSNPSQRTSSELLDDGPLGKTYRVSRIVDPQIKADGRIFDDTFRSTAVTAEVGWTTDDWVAGAAAHYTKGRRFRDSRLYNAWQDPIAGAATNGYIATIDAGAGNVENFRYELISPRSRIVDFSQPLNAPTGPAFIQSTSPANPGSRFTFESVDEDEQAIEKVLRADLERKIGWGPLAGIKAGAFARFIEERDRRALGNLLGTNIAGLNNSIYDFSSISGQPFFQGRLGAFNPADRMEFDVIRTTEILAPRPDPAAIPGSYIGKYGFLQVPNLSQGFDNEQRIYGGYAMINLNGPLTDLIALRGNIGVRQEWSERETLPRAATETNSFSYHNFLPSVNLALEFGSKFVLRGSYTHTLRRPEVDSFAVLRSVNTAQQILTINLGAAELRPFISKNIDISAEWYNRAGSVLSIAYFRKDVTDYAATQRICPLDGGDFGFGAFSTASGVCRTTVEIPAQGSLPALPAGSLVTINRIGNQDAFTLSGFEVTAQQNLSFLPAPWDGFGGQVNYTNVSFDTESTFRLSEISKHTVNAILYYENKLFGLRAAYNMRSAYFLAGGGTFAGEDRFVKARPQLDLSGQLNVTDRLTFTFEALNLTNRDLVEYQVVENRVRSYYTYGQTYTIGARYRF